MLTKRTASWPSGFSIEVVFLSLQSIVVLTGLTAVLYLLYKSQQKHGKSATIYKVPPPTTAHQSGFSIYCRNYWYDWILKYMMYWIIGVVIYFTILEALFAKFAKKNGQKLIAN